MVCNQTVTDVIFTEKVINVTIRIDYIFTPPDIGKGDITNIERCFTLKCIAEYRKQSVTPCYYNRISGTVLRGKFRYCSYISDIASLCYGSIYIIMILASVVYIIGDLIVKKEEIRI